MKDNKIYCDVLVIGAGASGVAAALAAARGKASVVLIEENSLPGGTAVLAMHNFICGVSHKADGLLGELLHDIAAGDFIKRGRVEILPFRKEKMVSSFYKAILREKRIKFMCNSRVVSVDKSSNRISSVLIKSSNIALVVFPKVVVDASGEGVIIKLSGARYSISPVNKRQLSGFSFKVKGIKGNKTGLHLKVPYYLNRAAINKKIPSYFKYTIFSPGFSRGEGYIRVNLPEPVRNNSHFTAKQASFVHNLLGKYIPELGYSNIVEVSPKVFPREGIRLLGRYTLTKEDVLKLKRFPDAVVKGYWPVEYWDRIKGPLFYYSCKNSFYEIPLRCLKSINVSNLFAAGRCISADIYASASARVVGTCISSGEAAGKAASLYARTFS